MPQEQSQSFARARTNDMKGALATVMRRVRQETWITHAIVRLHRLHADSRRAAKASSKFGDTSESASTPHRIGQRFLCWRERVLQGVSLPRFAGSFRTEPSAGRSSDVRRVICAMSATTSTRIDRSASRRPAGSRWSVDDRPSLCAGRSGRTQCLDSNGGVFGRPTAASISEDTSTTGPPAGPRKQQKARNDRHSSYECSMFSLNHPAARYKAGSGQTVRCVMSYPSGRGNRRIVCQKTCSLRGLASPRSGTGALLRKFRQQFYVADW